MVTMLKECRSAFACFVGLLLCVASLQAQQTLGSINGTVNDMSGGVVQRAQVKVRNNDTGLEQTTTTNADGSFSVSELPIGTYTVSFSRDGFKTEVHSRILVQANHTTTVNGAMQPGEVTV